MRAPLQAVKGSAGAWWTHVPKGADAHNAGGACLDWEREAGRGLILALCSRKKCFHTVFCG